MKHITIGKYTMTLVYKQMKTIRLAFNALTGEVTLTAPIGLSDVLIKQFVQAKLPWIDKHVAAAKARPPKPEYVSGEQHCLEGRSYCLQVVENSFINKISLEGNAIVLSLVSGSTAMQRETLLYNWYRARLSLRVVPLINKWKAIMGVKPTAWGIKRMKSRWGSCNTVKGNIWLSLELAKKGDTLLEYLIVHELAHLLEASHNDVFKGIMSKFMPDWKLRRAELNGKIKV